MREDGYTLAETLVALVVIGLAMGGLVTASRAIGLGQARATQALAENRGTTGAVRAMSGLLDRQGPFTEAGFQGRDAGFDFSCGEGTCAADLVHTPGAVTLQVRKSGKTTRSILTGVADAHFVYIGRYGVKSTWSSSMKDPEILRAVMLMSKGPGGEAPLAVVRLWREEPADCVFDPISGGCRPAAGG